MPQAGEKVPEPLSPFLPVTDRIGSGYGGLSWRKVRAIIERVFTDWPGTLIVYEEYVAES
jgi:hypothetical protein